MKESSLSDTDEFFDGTSNKPIYPGSKINIEEFDLSFLILCDRILISNKSRSLLLKFIKSLIPSNNFIPSTYSRLLKRNKIKKPNRILKCRECQSDFDSLSRQCQRCNNSKAFQIFKFDIRAQLSSIIEKEWDVIVNYKSNILSIFKFN